ncbi:MAG: TIGR02611 family protein [Candidatus Nomurabacteria bacterium]|nr:MAG: TIGR02611 family protein [Candidatus Nomurabacteria bacterium]
MRRRIKKTFVGIIGGLVVIVGIILIPYPGPGWLVVFTGLGILSTEYDFARRWLTYGRAKYDAWNVWTGKQSFIVKALIWLSTAAVVVATIWLVNGYGILNHLLGLGWNWLNSPLLIFR